jgi:WD40 repeat protein
MSVAAGIPASPFKGLAAFEDTDLDALFFCGREREREVVVANLVASRLTVLYGPSGVGKTSLLRAAVAHSLRSAHDAAVVVFSSWAGDPREGLGAAIDEAVGIEASGTLAERLRAASQAVRGHVYVILDQFEEYFLYHERGPFGDELADAIADPGLRASFLLGLREDALAKLDALKGQIPNLFANYLRLDHLDRAGARDAILGPIERYNELAGQNVRAEPELVEAVLDQVAAGRVDVGRAGRGGVETDEERIEAPYLQLVLERLWEAERAHGSDVLRLSTLRELGDADAIVRAHLTRALDRLPPSEQDVAATIFAHLVTPSGSKIAHRPGDLAQYAEVRETELGPVLEALGRERIVRAVDGAGDGARYEIFHDVLADGVLAWRARRELEHDRERAHERQRRLMVLAGLALVALTVVTAIAVYALTEHSHARSAARDARAAGLEATALAELPSDPQRALADAVKAARAAPSGVAAELLRQALVQARLRRILPVGGIVSAVAYEPHGDRILVGSSDGRVHLFSAAGTREHVLRVGAPVRAASFSPDGHVVVVAAGRVVTVWDAGRATRLRRLQMPGVAIAITLSRDGRLLLATSPRGAVVWRTATGRRIGALRPKGEVRAGTLSPDGRLAALIVQTGKKARGVVYAARSGRALHVLAASGLRTVAFSPNGKLLATAANDGTFVWDPRTGHRVRAFVDNKNSVNDAEFSPDGSLVATAGSDGATRVWDVTHGGRLFYFPQHTNPDVAVAWSPDGRFVADASPDRTTNVWMVSGTEEGKEFATLAGHLGGVTSVVFAPGGTSMLTGSADGTARLWDARFEQDLKPLGYHVGGASTASFGDEGRLVVSAGADGKARLWDVRSRRLLHVLSPRGGVNDARISPDGRLVLTADLDAGAGIWDARSGERVRTLHAGRALQARFSPDGKTIVTGDASGRVQLWRTRDGAELTSYKQRGGVADAEFSPDGKTVATSGSEGARLWPVAESPRQYLLASPDGVSRVAFSPDGKLLATAGRDGTARLWNVDHGRVRHILHASKLPLTDVVFSPDGRLLLTTSYLLKDNAATWDVRTGTRRHVLVGHFGPVSGGAFSPDGRWLVTSGPVTAGLWQRNGNRPYFYLRGDTSALTSVSFSPDGRLVLSSSSDGSVRLYRCEVCGNVDALVRLATRRLAQVK